MTGDEIAEFRRSLDISQQGLAERLGISVNTVSRWERGGMESPPYLWMALKWLAAEEKRHPGPKAKRAAPGVTA